MRTRLGCKLIGISARKRQQQHLTAPIEHNTSTTKTTRPPPPTTTPQPPNNSRPAFAHFLPHPPIHTQPALIQYLQGVVYGVGRFQRRNKPLRARQQLQRLKRLHVRYSGVFCPSTVLKPRVLGAHPRVVESGGDRVRFRDLAVRVLRAGRGGRKKEGEKRQVKKEKKEGKKKKEHTSRTAKKEKTESEQVENGKRKSGKRKANKKEQYQVHTITQPYTFFNSFSIGNL